MGAMCCVLRDAKNIGELHALPLAPSASGITSFHPGLRGRSGDRRDTEAWPLSDNQGSRADSNSVEFWHHWLVSRIVLGVSVKTCSFQVVWDWGGARACWEPSRTAHVQVSGHRVGAQRATWFSYSSASFAL